MAEHISREAIKQVLYGIANGLSVGETEALKTKDVKALYKIKGAKEILNAIDNDLSFIPAADVQPVNQWISVKDRLPEAVEEDVNGKIAFSELVLVYLVYDNGFTFITVDKCNTDKKRWLHEIPGEGCKVTHWQPLPKPPKED